MGKQIVAAWLPTAATWQAFVEVCGKNWSEPLDADSLRLTDHAAAVARLVELLTATGAKPAWLILAPPALAMRAAPDAELATQEGRAQAAVRLAEQRDHVLGIKATPDAIGWALVANQHERWQLVERERRGNVTILEAVVAGADSTEL